MIESLLLTTARVSTFFGSQALTVASGFFFQRGQDLYLITNRHVLFDQPSGHLPDRIEIDVHTDADNLTQVAALSVWLYQDGRAIWHQGNDGAGDIDVAAIRLDRDAMPAADLLRAFTPANLQLRLQEVQVGTPLLVVGFPLGFHDTLHHLPVVRQAVIASSFGLRFQGQGYFLTDARTHHGTSGAPVVMRDDSASAELPWRLLGVHSARLDMVGSSQQVEESLGLNCAWYADILLTLTAGGALDPDAAHSAS